MVEMSYVFGLFGGLMIGTAAAFYLLVNGQVMGASGILGSVVDGTAGPGRVEKLLFLFGLIAMPWVVSNFFALNPATHASGNAILIIVAGILVGMGTRLANGCTSGHGVCGISRLSRRGIVATLFYLLAGGLTVLLLKHGLGVN